MLASRTRCHIAQATHSGQLAKTLRNVNVAILFWPIVARSENFELPNEITIAVTSAICIVSEFEECVSIALILLNTPISRFLFGIFAWIYVS
jgi:hypothetical protein